MRARASVVIAVRNDVPGITATLAALARQTLPAAEREVIVVDDASTDATAAAAAAFDGVRVLRMPTAGGAYVARNRGIEAATGAVLAITDADCRPHPEWLERGLARLAGAPEAVIGGRIAMPLPPRAPLAAMVDVVHHLDQERYIAEQGFAVTANLMAARATFERVGGFNEALRSSGDVEWTKRAVAAGHPLLFARDAVVDHPPRSSARALLRKSRRVAEGGASVRREGRVRFGRPPYLNPGTLKPYNRERGWQRLHENGARPGRLRWLAVGGAQLALVQLPHALFALVADLRARRVRAPTGGAGASGDAR